ncbi:UNVERIFIED_CONTAM: hypothetical protein K2H54_018512 [Gekko kuhli]
MVRGRKTFWPVLDKPGTYSMDMPAKVRRGMHGAKLQNLSLSVSVLDPELSSDQTGFTSETEQIDLESNPELHSSKVIEVYRFRTTLRASYMFHISERK